MPSGAPTKASQEESRLTFLLIADEDLQGDGSLHFHGHLVVVDEAEAGQLQGCL